MYISESRNCLPEFVVMSRRPGIASEYIKDHPDWIEHPKDKIFISDAFGVKPVNVINSPDYFLRLIRDDYPDLYEDIKSDRRSSATIKNLFELQGTRLDEFQYSSLKEWLHEKSASTLLRSSVE